MEIIIHGSKGGYRVLYKTPKAPYDGAWDTRPLASNEDAVGSVAYSVVVLPEGVLYSKYKIIRDALRSKSTGNIGFSLFIPLNKKLKGEKVKEVLDELESHYSKKYIIENNNTPLTENFSFVEDIIKKYSGFEINNDQEFKPTYGTKLAAYRYYNEQPTLIQIFNRPYQEYYKEYKQIFLVDDVYKGQLNNPLNALIHDAAANLSDNEIHFFKKYIPPQQPNSDNKFPDDINKPNKDTTVKSKDNKLPTPLIIVFSIAFVLLSVVGTGIYLYLDYLNIREQIITNNKNIENYINDNELKESTLNTYLSNCNENNNNKPLLSKWVPALFPHVSCDANAIKQALTLRYLIKTGNIDSLKKIQSTIKYEKLRTSVDEIDRHKRDISKLLKENSERISNMSLDDIDSIINNYPTLLDAMDTSEVNKIDFPLANVKEQRLQELRDEIAKPNTKPMAPPIAGQPKKGGTKPSLKKPEDRIWEILFSTYPSLDSVKIYHNKINKNTNLYKILNKYLNTKCFTSLKNTIKNNKELQGVKDINKIIGKMKPEEKCN